MAVREHPVPDEIRRYVGILEGLLKADPDRDALTRETVSLLHFMSERIIALEEMFVELDEYVQSIDDDLLALEEGGVPGQEEEDRQPALKVLKPEDPVHYLQCESCKGVFRTKEPVSLYIGCPLCGKRTRAVILTEQNTPFADPEDQE